jgi:hypothetical protein
MTDDFQAGVPPDPGGHHDRQDHDDGQGDHGEPNPFRRVPDPGESLRPVLRWLPFIMAAFLAVGCLIYSLCGSMQPRKQF